MPKPKVLNQRAHEIKLIHIGKSKLSMDDATYRTMLQAQTGKSSSAELDDAGRAQVLMHLIASGAKLHWSRRSAVQAAEAKAPLIKKVRALLIQLGNYTDSYADGIAKRMYKVDRFEWLDPRQLMGIVTALTKQLDKVRAGGVKKVAQ